jgi:hypothetical protein
MVVPLEFVELTICFWDGSDEEVVTVEAWVEHCGQLLSFEKVPIVRGFLRKLMASNPSNADLADVWAHGASSYGLMDHPDTRKLFELLLATMEQRMATRM